MPIKWRRVGLKSHVSVLNPIFSAPLLAFAQIESESMTWDRKSCLEQRQTSIFFSCEVIFFGLAQHPEYFSVDVSSSWDNGFMISFIWFRWLNLRLKCHVDCFVLLPACRYGALVITHSKMVNNDSVLECHTSSGLLEGQIRWFDKEGKEKKGANTNTMKTDRGLFQLSSRLILQDGLAASKYTCAVFNASGGQEEEAIWESPKSQSMTCLRPPLRFSCYRRSYCGSKSANH